MLGSLADAEDAVQEAWVRLGSVDENEVLNLSGWLTTVVSRISLDKLRSRKARREDTLDIEAVEASAEGQIRIDPEQEAQLAESIGIALLVILDRLAPVERLAFVLHDLFGIAFDDIGPIIGRTPVTARQIASRARRRVRGNYEDAPTKTLEQRKLVSAFFTASRDGNFEALLEVLDPDVELSADQFTSPNNVPQFARGAHLVAKRAQMGAKRSAQAELMLVNDDVGIVLAPAGHLLLVMLFQIKNEKIVHIDVIADRERLKSFDLALLDG
jgi:RNA polymerase sigma factor (sigma-70 family)